MGNWELGIGNWEYSISQSGEVQSQNLTPKPSTCKS